MNGDDIGACDRGVEIGGRLAAGRDDVGGRHIGIVDEPRISIARARLAVRVRAAEADDQRVFSARSTGKAVQRSSSDFRAPVLLTLPAWRAHTS